MWQKVHVRLYSCYLSFKLTCVTQDVFLLNIISGTRWGRLSYTSLFADTGWMDGSAQCRTLTQEPAVNISAPVNTLRRFPSTMTTFLNLKGRSMSTCSPTFETSWTVCRVQSAAVVHIFIMHIWSHLHSHTHILSLMSSVVDVLFTHTQNHHVVLTVEMLKSCFWNNK